jgi:hypothetical protein
MRSVRSCDDRWPMADADPPAAGAPTAAVVAFVTTEHFTLQGARSQTVSEATGRASIFLASVSGGLVALGLMATAAHIGTAFYALALTLLPTLAFVGLVTFDRVLQNGLEHLTYANRIARLRAFYFDHAPELDAYLLSAPPERRLLMQGLNEGLWQNFVTIAGMVAVITSVLAGASVALLVAVLANHSITPAVASLLTVSLATSPFSNVRPPVVWPWTASRRVSCGRAAHRFTVRLFPLVRERPRSGRDHLSSFSGAPTRPRIATPTLGLIGLCAALVIVFAGNYHVPSGENGGTGPGIVTGIICLVLAAGLFGYVVPRTVNVDRTAFVLAVLAIVSIVAFWSGVTPLLATASLAVSQPGATTAARRVRVVQALAVTAGIAALMVTLAQSHL